MPATFLFSDVFLMADLCYTRAGETGHSLNKMDWSGQLRMEVEMTGDVLLAASLPVNAGRTDSPSLTFVAAKVFPTIYVDQEGET